MHTIDFTEPVRQSVKGVFIIFGFKLFRFAKRFLVLFLAFGISIIQKKSFINLSTAFIVIIFIAIIIGIFAVSVLKFLNFKFYVTKSDFHLSTGILNKDNIVIPKSKIQNVNIKQNFLQQIINVVSVNIETAGDDKSEIEISALDKQNAVKLKELLFVKTSDSGVEETAESNLIGEDQIFFKASIKRLLLEGISENHFKSFLIVISFVFGIYYQIKDYFKNLSFEEQIENNIRSIESGMVSLLIFNLVVVFVFMLVSVLFSVIKTLVINFNLEVIEHRKNIEINKGLFNKISLALTPSRIQNLVIKTNRFKEFLGLYRLSVKQAMVNKKQQKNFNIVALDKVQIEYLVDKLLKSYSKPSHYSQPEAYFKYILGLRLAFLFLILNIPAYFIFGNRFWLINSLFILFSAFYVHIRFKKTGYHISEEFVSLRSGFIDTLTNVLEIHKIQSITLRQSFFQKRRGIASVDISTASKTVTVLYIREDTAKNICDLLIYKVESSKQDWM